MTVRVGDPAPDFSLPGTDGTAAGRREHALSELRGAPVVLVFYPGDATPVCTRQLTTYSAEVDRFRSLDAQLLAISPQSLESHEAFSAAANSPTPSLALRDDAMNAW